MKRAMPRTGRTALLRSALLGSSLLASIPAAADWEQALDNDYYKVHLNLRARVETAEADGQRQSTAVTFRTRLGVGSKPWRGFSVYAEMEANSPIDEEAYFNVVDAPNTRNKTAIADPAFVELNRAFARYTNAEAWDTDLVAGRQRIIFDDARFIGNVGWRQNEQTFDSARGSTSFGVEDLKVDYSYLWNINRIFGNQGGPATQDWNSNSHLLHASFDRHPLAKAAFFTYLLDFDQSGPNSSNSYGFRLQGKKALTKQWVVGYLGSFAWQSDARNNPVDYVAPYGWATASVGHTDWATLLFTYEHLGSDGGDAQFRTPLATAHKFNGWADAFLDNGGSDGLQDFFVTLAPKLPWKLDGRIVYHRFWSAHRGRNAGQEIDFLIKRPINKYFTFLTKGGFFDGQGGGATTSGRADVFRFSAEVTFSY